MEACLFVVLVFIMILSSLPVIHVEIDSEDNLSGWGGSLISATDNWCIVSYGKMDNLDVQTSSQNTEEFEVANYSLQDLSEQTNEEMDTAIAEQDAKVLAEQAGFNNSIVQAFEGKTVRDLVAITSDDLHGMQIYGKAAQQIWRWLPTIETNGEWKVFNDPIHGHIQFHPLLVAIIDTPQFQRLRDIKQLGGGYYVYPGASHNRFEHSLGVCYLAGELVESLQHRQPELGITPCDVLCVKIAGLCHDLGHGPFSHLFEKGFISRFGKWEHEEASISMLHHLIDENKLMPMFEKYGLKRHPDITFIEELIKGKCSEGRPENKSFLYEIVANKRNEVDVDKWDYFARDCHSLGIPNNFDHHRYIKFCRVIDVDSTLQICCRDKELMNLYEMFHTRFILHKKAYQHKTVKAVEGMISDGLEAANDHIKFMGKNGEFVKMSDAIHDMFAYTNLTDSVVQMIMASSYPKLKPAQNIFRNLKLRQIYRFIGQTIFCELSHEEIKKQIVDLQGNHRLLEESDIHLENVSFNYGIKDGKNPIDNMKFYKKDNPSKAFNIDKEEVSKMLLPKRLSEKIIYFYCKKFDQECFKVAQKCFEKWSFEKWSTESKSPYVATTPQKNKTDAEDNPQHKKRKLAF